MFHPWCFFCSTPNLGGPLADRHETLPHHRNLALLYNPSPKFQGALPQKIRGAKNMQNFGRFFCNVRLWLRISPERLKYPNRNSKFFYIDSSRVLRNKSSELWSTNFSRFRCEFGPSKMHFLGILYLSPQGVLRPEIFTPATVWPRLPSAHPNWDGGPPKKFNREN